MDDLDRRMIELLAAEPRIGVLEASRRLGIAHSTLYDTMKRLGIESKNKRKAASGL